MTRPTRHLGAVDPERHARYQARFERWCDRAAVRSGLESYAAIALGLLVVFVLAYAMCAEAGR